MAEIDKYLKMAKDINASDIHLAVGAPPMVRLHGRLMKGKAPPITAEQNERLIFEMLTPEQKKKFLETKELDFCYEIQGVGRFRGNILKQRKGFDATFRVIPSKIHTLEELGFPEVIHKLLNYRQGLVLVTGQAGCGKTTTLAAMVDYLNFNRREHIVTVEDPIEIIHRNKACQVNQREIGTHTSSFAIALRAALREAPDIILVGEMRDLETIGMAITAAETGHLVLGTLHTNSASRTISRILDAFPPQEQPQVRAMLSESLRGIISQQLIPRADGKGRVLALEILVCTPAISNMIREDRTFQIPSLMQIGVKQGMCLMDNSLLDLLRKGLITREEAYDRAEDKNRFAAVEMKGGESRGKD